MNDFKKGDHVTTPEGTRAVFLHYTGAANKGSAVIQVGLDTRVVAAVTLRKAS